MTTVPAAEVVPTLWGDPLPDYMMPIVQQTGIFDVATPDATVEQRIKTLEHAAIPYTWLTVHKAPHFFEGNPQLKNCRVIELQTTNFQWYWNFACLKLYRGTTQESMHRVTLGALGSPDPSDQREVRAAYNKNYYLRIFADMHGSKKLELDFKQGENSLKDACIIS